MLSVAKTVAATGETTFALAAAATVVPDTSTRPATGAVNISARSALHAASGVSDCVCQREDTCMATCSRRIREFAASTSPICSQASFMYSSALVSTTCVPKSAATRISRIEIQLVHPVRVVRRRRSIAVE